jgi:nucleoid-associated protein YgaU
MAGWSDLNNGAKGALGAVVAVGLGIVGWLALGPVAKAPMPAVQASGDSAETAPADAAVAAEAPAAEAEVPEVMLALEAPEIDVLRVAPDGTTTLAGRTEPMARVSIQVDGVEVAEVTSGTNGQFATVFTLAPWPAPRLMALVATLADGTVLGASEGVAIAPIEAPEPEVAVAEAETAAAEAAPDGATDVAVENSAQIPEEPAAPATILLTQDGAEVLQPATAVAAEIAGEISLDVIAYTASGAVQFAGTAAAGSVLILYLDTLEAGRVSVGADGKWSLTSDTIAPGRYTLRIDQLEGADGKVTSRLETPFQRETLEALAAAAAPAEVAEEMGEAMPETVDVAVADAATAEPPAEPAATELAMAKTDTSQPEALEAATPEIAPDAPATDLASVQAPDAGTATSALAPATDPAVLADEDSALAGPSSDPAPAASSGPITITVQPGFTLWAIAKDQFGSGVMYVQVYDANRDKIKDPDLIYPGQVLSVPASP